MLKLVERTPAGEQDSKLLLLDEVARSGARRMLMAALALRGGEATIRTAPAGGG